MSCHPCVAVVQDGSRLHYAVPLALQKVGILSHVYCDWYSKPYSLSFLISMLVGLRSPNLSKKMLGRFEPLLESQKVRSNPFLKISQILNRSRFTKSEEFYSWYSRETAAWIRRDCFGEANALFGFSRHIHPDLLLDAKNLGLQTVVDQIIAPSVLEQEELARQVDLYPELATPNDTTKDVVIPDFEQKTWRYSDQITCASTYVRDGLVKMGVPPSKITVIPYPIDTNYYPNVDRSKRVGPVIVGFVGSINLRKGIPYFFEVAKQFDPKKARFIAVGPIGVNSDSIERYRGNVELVGPVPRADIRQWLSRFDIFFFPSTCEGSAGSIMEAMASGLPIVTTPNSGSIVRDQIDGFINLYSDIGRHVECIQQLLDKNTRFSFGLQARKNVESCDLNAYGNRLASLFI